MRIRFLGFVALVVFLVAGVALPGRLIDSGLEDFEGREKRMAFDALVHVGTYFGWSSLDPWEYIGPPLVLGWRIEEVEPCLGKPTREDYQMASYRAEIGARAKIGAYTLFGIPRGEVKVNCEGHRNWEPYF